MNAYHFDFASRTLTMTKAFADKASIPDSDEYSIVKAFQADFPDLHISYRTHRTPTQYKNANGTKTKNNQFKGLSFERMEKFINAIPNGEKFKEPFSFLKEQSSYTQTAKWFMKQFPNYRENPLYYLNNDVEVISFADYVPEKTTDEAEKESA